MQFLLIIGHDDSFGPNPKLIRDIMDWNRAMHEKGILEYSNPLEPWQNAKHIRTVGGKIVIEDGSFSTSKEKIAAYALIKSDSITTAIELASSHPMAKHAVIEIRPVWEDISG